MNGEGKREAGLKIRKMVTDDISNVRELSRIVWANQLFKDSGIEVEYPAREKKVYKAYIETEPDGNLVAEVKGELVGAAYSHTWGTIGWIGPVEIDPKWQGLGIGKTLMRSSETYLRFKQCNVIGVETMGDNDKNLSFYRSLGYSIHSPTFVYEKILDEGKRLSGRTEIMPPSQCEASLSSFFDIANSIFTGMDLGKEFKVACSGELGRVLVVRDEKEKERVLGASIVHERTVEGISSHLLRALIVDPSSDGKGEVFSALLNDSEVVAKGMGAMKVFFTSSVSARSVTALADRGYKVIGNNVRMLRSGAYSEKGDFQLISWAG